MPQSPDEHERDKELKQATEVYSSFLRQRPGEAGKLEQLCLEYAALASTLRVLHEGYLLAQALATASSFPPSVGDRVDDDFEATVALDSEVIENLDGDRTIARDQLESSRSAHGGAAVGGAASAHPGPGHATKKPSISIGRYRIEDEVAHGGMGVIYRVVDRELKRTLAMKVMRVVPGSGESTRDETQMLVARFAEEAQVTAQLDHPGVVPVHDMGTDGEGRTYFTMKLVRGRHLGDIFEMSRSEQDGWNLPRAIGVMVKVCQAIAYAHDKKVIHRDLKPSNIMVGRFGEVYVMDWGLAKVKGRHDLHDIRPNPDTLLTYASVRSDRRSEAESGDDSPLVTMDGSVVGTPAYMPPEQAKGMVGEVDHASDIYSLGAILYNLLTGQAPFVEPGATISPHTILARVLDGPPKRVHQLNVRASAELEAICDKAMARSKSARYGSCQELAEDLQAYLDGRVVHAYRTGALAEFKYWVGRNKGWSSSLAVALVLVLCGSLAFALMQRRARQRIAREHYYGSIAAAQKYIESGNTAQARELLLNCAPEYRHWEWGRCLFLCNQSITTIPAASTSLVSLKIGRGSRRLLTRTPIGTAKLWDLQTGHELLRVGQPSNRVQGAEISPDGMLLATIHDDGSVQIWDAIAAQEITPRLPGHDGSATDLSFHPSGSRLATAGADSLVKVWDLSAMRLLYEIGASETIAGIGISPDGMRLIIIGAQRSTVWNAETGEQLFVANIPHEKYTTRAMSPDGQKFATIEPDGHVELCDAQSGDHLLTLPRTGYAVVNVSFRPDGRFVGTFHEDGSVTGWNTETGDQMTLSAGRIFDIDGSEDYGILAVTSGELVARVLDGMRGKVVKTLRGHSAIVDRVAVSPDGARVATSDRDGIVKVWISDASRERLPMQVGYTAVAISPDGRRVATGHWNGEVNVWDGDSGKLVMRIERFFQQVLALAFDPHGQYLAAAGGDGWVDVIRLADGQTFRKLDGHGRLIYGIDYSPDGAHLASASSDSTVKLWNIESGEEVQRFAGHTGPVSSVDFHYSGHRFASAGWDKSVRIWDVQTGRQVAAWEAGTEVIYRVVYSPDGKLLATAGQDGTVRIWDASRKTTRHVIQSPAAVFSVAFSPDGKRIVGVSGENNALGSPAVTLWDVSTGRQVFTFPENSGLLYAVRFSLDGTRILTANPAIQGLLRGDAAVWEAFPWEAEAYAGNDEAPFADRVDAYARRYWEDRLARAELDRHENPIVVRRGPRNWPSRDNRTPADALDLTAFYNRSLSASLLPHAKIQDEGNDLTSLPVGFVTLANTPLDIRGVIQTANRVWTDWLPKEVSGIPLGRVFHRLHVLHGTAYRESNGTAIGSLRLNYADGEQRDIPLKYGVDVRDWHFTSGSPFQAEQAMIAWTGQNLRTASSGTTLRLYKSVIENPRPRTEVTSVDYASRLTQCAPFLIAITVDAAEDELVFYQDSNKYLVDAFLAQPDETQARLQLADSWKQLGQAVHGTPHAQAAAAFHELSILLVMSSITKPIRSQKMLMPRTQEDLSGDAHEDAEVSSTTLVAEGRKWRYWDRGSPPPPHWNTMIFDDAAWAEGYAPLGYGEQNLATTIGFGSDEQNKHVTTYFRRTFTLDDAEQVPLARFKVTRDDGVIVYLNGEELVRDNLPARVNANTFASTRQEPTELEWLVPSARLRSGKNVIAAEIHQVNRTSSDVVFRLELDALLLPMDVEALASRLIGNGFHFPPQLKSYLRRPRLRTGGD